VSTLPVLPLPNGVEWDSHKSPRFNTVTQNPVSGARPVSFSVSQFPSWAWELSFEVLRDQGLWPATGDVPAGENSSSDLKPDLFALQDFYLVMNGANGRFVYDPAANVIPLEDTFVTNVIVGTLVNGYSGTTNGTEAIFQLYRTSKVTGSLVPVEAIDALSAMSMGIGSPNPFALYLDNVLVDPSLYTLSQYPLQVTFGTPPAAGKALAWNGNAAYVVKFAEDSLDFSQFVEHLWDLQSLRLEQVCLGF
jgi:hypothetical protein